MSKQNQFVASWAARWVKVLAESPTTVCFTFMWYFKIEVLWWKENLFQQLTVPSLGFFVFFCFYIHGANVLFSIFHLYRLLRLPVTAGSTAYLCMRNANSTWTNCPKCVARVIHRWVNCVKILNQIFRDGLLCINTFILTPLEVTSQIFRDLLTFTLFRNLLNCHEKFHTEHETD